MFMIQTHLGIQMCLLLVTMVAVPSFLECSELLLHNEVSAAPLRVHGVHPELPTKSLIPKYLVIPRYLCLGSPCHSNGHLK